jgi:hypothetical protein
MPLEAQPSGPTNNLPPKPSAAASRVGVLLNAATHKLRFPKYDGSKDMLPWLHRCEQFFRVVRTPENEKVWLASFYMEGAAHEWYYRLEQNASFYMVGAAHEWYYRLEQN